MGDFRLIKREKREIPETGWGKRDSCGCSAFLNQYSLPRLNARNSAALDKKSANKLLRGLINQRTALTG